MTLQCSACAARAVDTIQDEQGETVPVCQIHLEDREREEVMCG